jgi:hypothetical protein
MDLTRMRNEDPKPKEVKSRVRDLFNLKDPNFKETRSSQRSSFLAHHHW